MIAFTRRHVIACFALWTALAAVAAYFTMLSDFSLYDDEGALMITVKPYLAGMKLYDQIFSSYGPVYYFYRWAIHTLTGTPVTHDAVRLSALLPWLATALLCGWIALRLTRSLVWAGLAHLLTSWVLVFFSWEPGHPQDLTILLLVTLAAVPLLAGRWGGPPGPRPTPWSACPSPKSLLMLALGALPAALLLVKINIGAFAIAAVTLGLLASGPPTRVWRFLAWTSGAVCAALPALLMRPHLDNPEIRTYCWLATASVAACALCLLRTAPVTHALMRAASSLTPRPEHPITPRDCLLALAAFAVTFAAVIAILLVQGTTLAAIYESLVVTPARIFLTHPHWVVEPRLLSWTTPWALVGIAAALWAAWKLPLPGTRAHHLLLAGKCAFCLVALVVLCLDLPLLSVVPPFVWLVLFFPGASHDDVQAFPRRLLAILTALQILYAYPVAGSQARFTLVLLRLILIVCLGDSLAWLSDVVRLPEKLALWWTAWRRTAAVAALAAIALAHGYEAFDYYRYYHDWTPLDLPGARLVHTDPESVANFHWLASNLKQHCDAFESLPGLPSLNFWTGIAPLTGLNVDAWIISLSPLQQQQVADALNTHPGACIVYNPAILQQWNLDGTSLDDLPLVHYIFQNFHTVGHTGDYQLMLRNGRRDTPSLR